MEPAVKDIIILGSGKFDGEYQSAIFTLARQFARDHRVFYVDYPYTFTDCIKFRNSSQYHIRRPHFSKKAAGIIATEHPNLKVVITPPLLPINFLAEGDMYRKLLKLNEAVIAARIKSVIQRFNIEDFIYINSFNFHYPGLADLINPSLRIYHSVDPLIIPYDMKHGIVSEKLLIEQSDLVVCTSRQLYLEKKELNPQTYFIPNAADIGHSRKAMLPELPLYPAVANLPKPVVGFIGNIERRMDFELLKQVVGKNPEKSFVFAGPVSQEFTPDWFFRTPNIHLIGKIPYNQLPAVLKGFDVALIPFKKDEVSATIFPLKLFEYLGAGKAVVATSFNEDLKNWTAGTVSYCDDPESFSQAINEALTSTEQQLNERLEVAANNTWEKRADAFRELFKLNAKNYLNENK